jgi:dihydroorotase
MYVYLCGGCGGGNNSAAVFKRAIIMPNLKPPVTTVAAAVSYRERILKVLPSDSVFEPLMTLYLTDATTKDEIQRASECF